MDILPILQQLAATNSSGENELRKEVAAHLNYLLLHDFPSLVQLLYRVDVPEHKVKTALKEHPYEDAGNLIADLLIKRQQEKITTKQQFRFSTNESEEERW